MFSKKSLPVLLLILLAGTFIAFNSLGTGNPPTKYEKILRQVGEMLEDAHYSPKKIDDGFSKEIFKKFLAGLDPDKNIFLQSDIAALKKFETKIDDEIHGSAVQFFPAANDIYQKRLAEVSGIYKQILSKPFTFNTDENIVIDPEKLNYTSSETQRADAWRKKIKYLTLERYADLLDTREKNKGTEGFVVKTDAELEKEAREKVMKIMDRNFERLKNKFTEEDRFNMLVNTITTTMDPHTVFFPPVEKRYFDEQMSGRFFGIGASLRGEEGAIKIATLVTGSPAWKSGQVQIGDAILKVGQGADEAVDVTGFDVDDAVKLIRGKKGTEVKLTLKKADGSVKTVALVREEIVVEETFARSTIISQADKKIGYIFLPEFYADWERPNGARSAQDVAKEIIKLKEQRVDGIIMDLRNNGGGSLYDVVQMVGFFIEDGPIVQVKDRDGNPSVLRDRDKTVLYDGPLAVMVNEFSASASEIFAAAIQDYKRGVVIGSSTYGKGTVQRNIGLEKEGGFMASNTPGAGITTQELGTVKLTLQKFYRINGGSTQLKGVTPDIQIPDKYEYFKFREKDDPDALQWDEIQKTNYSNYSGGYDLNAVQKASLERINSNASLSTIRENTSLLAKMNDKEYSLNIDKYRKEQKDIRSAIRKMEGLEKTQNAMDIQMLPQDEKKLAADNDKLERRKAWIKNLSNDVYVNETVNVISDMIRQSLMAKSN
ncbi:MAG: carboxy terminal-processing peptidase [Chitinophagaceae bacterium]|nr:carboxy terminal-processing peptidase [Chitinophagaceae bacterium]